MSAIPFMNVTLQKIKEKLDMRRQETSPQGNFINNVIPMESSLLCHSLELITQKCSYIFHES